MVRALHRASRRKEQAFIEVNLASIPGENIAIELFGYEDGDSIQAGRFEQAHGGTLVLDEIGDLDLEIQAKLLSTLEERRFYRIGGKHVLSSMSESSPHPTRTLNQRHDRAHSEKICSIVSMPFQSTFQH